MPLPIPALAHPAALAATSLLAATSKKSSSGSPIFFIFLIVIVGVYFLFVAPQRRKMRAQVNQQAAYQVGDEVVTKGGIFGRVVRTDGDRVRLEIAPGTSIDVLQASIARRVDPVVETDDEDDDTHYHDDDDDTADHHDEDGTHGANGTGEPSGWTEPVHEGWNEPTHEELPEQTGGARGSASPSGGPS